MKRSMMFLAAALLALAACEEKKAETKPDDPTAKNTTTTNATGTVATPQPVVVTIADSDLSTPADFEENAEKSITKTNYKTELASLDTDITKDQAAAQ